MMYYPRLSLAIRDRALEEGNQFQQHLAVHQFLNHTTTHPSTQPLSKDPHTYKCSILSRRARYSEAFLRRTEF